MSRLFQGDTHKQIRTQRTRIEDLQIERHALQQGNQEQQTRLETQCKTMEAQRSQLQGLMRRFQEYKEETERSSRPGLEEEFKSYIQGSYSKLKSGEQDRQRLLLRVKSLEQSQEQHSQQSIMYK